MLIQDKIIKHLIMLIEVIDVRRIFLFLKHVLFQSDHH
jgi:hypothetical protein